MLLALLALAGSGCSAVVQILAPLLRPDIDFVHGALSEYAVGQWGLLNSLGFVGLGIAALSIAAALLWRGVASIWAALAVASLTLAGVFSLGSAWYPMGASGPVTPIGDAHQSATTLAAASFLTAMASLLPVFHDSADWSSRVLPSAALTALGVLSALITQAQILWPQLGVPFGIAMRGVSFAIGVWTLLVAIHLWPFAQNVRSRSTGAR
ncbi:MAG: DUF998 domain-containing protein [Thermomicrobiales bacterium]